MEPNSADSPVATPRWHPWYHWRRLGLNFLTISILAHLLFGVIAAYLIVQTIHAPRKQTFAGGPKGESAPKRALEHKVQLQKQRQSMSAPTAKRVTTTGLSKVSLPTMPTLPMDSVVTPMSMSGMGGGAGLGLGKGGGSGGGGGGGGGGVSLFGLRQGKGLKGTFYDLKQTSGQRPTTIDTVAKFVHELDLFLLGGWNEGSLAKYFKAPVTLYATQIFVPHIWSDEATKAFGVESLVKPALWMALYKGQVSPPESGTYHFVGGGDNILIVRINGKIVLDRSWNYQELFGIDKYWKPVAEYDYGFGDVPKGFAKGQAVELSAGTFYDMAILVGDDGGAANFSLLVEKEGVNYDKTGSGLPILPVFRVSRDAPPPGNHPPFQQDGPVWQCRSEQVPIL